MQAIVAFDESGNSGSHLLDHEQPVFVLASVSMTDECARELLPSRPSEHKFSSLKRSPSGQQTIVDTLNSPLLAESVVISVVHKRYMALSKLVDLLIEPVLHQRGIDLYERGANIGLVNMLYVTLPALLGVGAFNELIGRFVAMMRDTNIRTIERFYKYVGTAIRKHRDERQLIQELFLIQSTRVLAESYSNGRDASILDPAIPTFVDHGATWTARLQEPFLIVHDTSKPLIHEQLLLEAMMSETEPRKTIGYDRRTMQFPIAASRIEFRDSKSCLQLQVADIVAGATCLYLKADLLGSHNIFSKVVGATLVLNQPMLPLWPSTAVTPDELGTDQVGGIEPNDFVGQYVSDRLGGIPPVGARRKK